MFDHVTIRVADRGPAERFFEELLEPLGIESTYRTGAFTLWHDFIVTQADASHPVTERAHIAFVAPTTEQVDDFHRTGLALGATDDGPPGPRPYRDDYYGAFLRDSAGNSIEAVNYGDMRRGDGKVDHVAMRVADLASSIAFYRAVGQCVGFELVRESDERAAFAGPDGGLVSVVAGPPTVGLHLAFGGDDDSVRRFYDDLTTAGYRGNGGPHERSRYHPGYYAAYVFDPDGNNIEVVNHHLAG
jgi:catechol 2,3-dioxygenase-like lactoylglutathione lyase family enzyme